MWWRRKKTVYYSLIKAINSVRAQIVCQVPLWELVGGKEGWKSCEWTCNAGAVCWTELSQAFPILKLKKSGTYFPD